jgi:hypothetical protein
MTFTANICSNTLISSKIAFNYKNETYLISTSYVIDYPNKIINELNKLGISIINNYPECNWYRIKQVWNTGVNTCNIYIQGPNYSIENIQSVVDLLQKHYPITETLVGIGLGLILPYILLVFFILYYKYYKKNNTRQMINILKQNVIKNRNIIKKKEIDDKIKDYLFNPPSYELGYSKKTFKENLKSEYDLNHHKYIDEKFEEYTELYNSNGNGNCCIKCKREKVKLYKNKYDLYECEKCHL